MSNELDKFHLVDRNLLCEDNYFQSLLEQACNVDLLKKNDIERIQYECLNLIAEKTERYNAGDSSSIQVEKAKEIMNSIFFTIGLHLKSYLYPDDAVYCLQHRRISEVYQDGRKKIDKMLAVTKTVHARLISKLINTQNVFYNSTLNDGIKGFFKLYYPDFFAHETHITADYPLLNEIPKLKGIEFIRAYIWAAYYENQFMNYFSTDDIHHLLCGYEKNYQKLLMNLYEPVLITSLGCVIAETDLYHLDITMSGIDILVKTFEHKLKDEIEEIISNSAKKLCKKLKCSNELFQYIQKSLPLIVGEINTAISEDSLYRVFKLPVYPEDNPKIIFSYGEKMDNELYRNVLDKITRCDSLQEKISVIKNSIHSIADLEDILLDSEMTSFEIQGVLCELTLPEIAILSKKYLLQFDIDTLNLRKGEKLLRESLKDFISKLSIEKQNIIKRIEVSLKER